LGDAKKKSKSKRHDSQSTTKEDRYGTHFKKRLIPIWAGEES